VTREQEKTMLPIALKLFPLWVIRDFNITTGTDILEERLLLNTYASTCAGFASDLREIMLQERYEEDDEAALLFDIVLQVCYELAYGAPSPWRTEGYEAFWRLYRTNIGSQVLQELGRRSNLIKTLSSTALER
jgi:hypothetical protein